MRQTLKTCPNHFQGSVRAIGVGHENANLECPALFEPLRMPHVPGSLGLFWTRARSPSRSLRRHDNPIWICLEWRSWCGERAVHSRARDPFGTGDAQGPGRAFNRSNDDEAQYLDAQTLVVLPVDSGSASLDGPANLHAPHYALHKPAIDSA